MLLIVCRAGSRIPARPRACGLYPRGVADSEVIERVAARRAELDVLEEQLVKQLAQVRAEREELALTDEKSRLIWISAARLRRTHGTAAARRDRILAHLRQVGLGFLGLDDDTENPMVVTGYKAARARKLTKGQRKANQILSAARAPVEHGFAHLKNWRILTKLRMAPARATNLLRALLVLTNLEVNR